MEIWREVGGSWGREEVMKGVLKYRKDKVTSLASLAAPLTGVTSGEGRPGSL